MQAETAVEVHVRSLLVKLMVHSGMTEADADGKIDTDDGYWGVKKKIKRLDDWTAKYCTTLGTPSTSLVGSKIWQDWDAELYSRRNAAVHAGASSFTYEQALRAIGIAKEFIVTVEAKVPGLQNRIQLNPSMSNFRINAGEVMF